MSLLASLLRNVPAPGAALELAASHVSGIVVERRGESIGVVGHARAAVPPGALVPSLGGSNLHDRAAVAAAVDRVLEQIGRPRRVGLIVPDHAAKVSIVTLEKVPARVEDLDQIIRWQIRKAIPFPLDDAQVGYTRGAQVADGRSFVVAVMKRDVLAEYEALAEARGAHVGLVDLATFNVANAVLATPPAPAGDWLLVRAAGSEGSVAILRGPDLLFFRSRGADTSGTLADLVHQTAMYFEDRLKGERFERIVLSGLRGPEAEAARRDLETRLASPVTTLDLRDVASVGDRVSTAPALIDELAPLVGLLARERHAA
jgi:hypothetical protein